MNSCCTKPVEVIVEDKHKPTEQCCLVTDVTTAPSRAECPISKTLSKKVQLRTLEHLLKPDIVNKIQNAQYYFCADPNCKVVYFAFESTSNFTIEDVSVEVLAKSKTESVNVCYCFCWTRSRIKEELVNTGHSTASLQIAKEVKAGNCACDIKNPKGECCLGDVNFYVKSLISISKTYKNI